MGETSIYVDLPVEHEVLAFPSNTKQNPRQEQTNQDGSCGKLFLRIIAVRTRFQSLKFLPLKSSFYVQIPNAFIKERTPAKKRTPITMLRITEGLTFGSSFEPIFAPSIMPTIEGTVSIGKTAPLFM